MADSGTALTGQVVAITGASSAHAFVRGAAERFGGLDALVNNAG